MLSFCLSLVVLGDGEKPDPGGKGSSAAVCHWKVCQLDFQWYVYTNNVYEELL